MSDLSDEKLAELIAIYDEDAELVAFLRELQRHRASALPAVGQLTLTVPDSLSAGTADLVQRFAQAMLEKLAKAEDKYGYGIGWMDDHWEDDCRHKFAEHIDKGDPVDVANYCAFMWHHGWATGALPAVGDDELEVWERVLPHPQAGTSDLRYLHSLAISRAHAVFPTAENVERVARAICDCDPDAETAVTGWTMLPDRTGRRTIQEPTPIKAWQRFVAKARLAIAAMSTAPSADVEKIGRAAIKAADEFGPIGNADSYEQWRKEQAVAVGSAVVALSAAPSGDGALYESEAAKRGDRPLRVRGVGRDAGEPRSVSVALTGVPTDDEMRDLHDYLREWSKP